MSSECSGNIREPILAAPLSSDHSMKQQGFKICSPDEEGLSRASNVSFTSMPPMHFIEHQMDQLDLQNIQSTGGGVCSKSRSEPVGSSAAYTNKDVAPTGQAGVCGQRSYYRPHWSMEAIEKALEVSTAVCVCV